MRGKQINSGISMSVKENQLQFKLGKSTFGIQVKDRFQSDEIQAVFDYLAEPEIIDKKAIQTFIEKEYCINTYRPCYATLVPKLIRGKYRVDLGIRDINLEKVSLVRILERRPLLIHRIRRLVLKTYPNEETVFKNPNDWKDFIIVQWIEADGRPIHRIIMRMVRLKKVEKFGDTRIIIKD